LIAGVAGLALLAVSSPRRLIRHVATGIAGIELMQRALFRMRASDQRQPRVAGE